MHTFGACFRHAAALRSWFQIMTNVLRKPNCFGACVWQPGTGRRIFRGAPPPARCLNRPRAALWECARSSKFKCAAPAEWTGFWNGMVPLMPYTPPQTNRMRRRAFCVGTGRHLQARVDICRYCRHCRHCGHAAALKCAFLPRKCGAVIERKCGWALSIEQHGVPAVRIVRVVYETKCGPY